MIYRVFLASGVRLTLGFLCIEFMTPTYVTEIAPVKIRGSLLMTYNFWFGFGQFAATLALQRMNATDPTNFRLPIYTQVDRAI
jgi:SP family general alpha glucoside:H+ symporter-like MFS transporter